MVRGSPPRENGINITTWGDTRSMRTFLLIAAGIIGVIVLGSVLVAVLKVAVSVLFYVFIAALLVFGVMFLFGKVRNSLNR